MGQEEKDKNQKKYTYTEAKARAWSYCAYQERSQQQVRDKLYEYGLYPDEVESLIAELISDNFINEERFAKTYAGGKFRIKKWGRHKIRQGLKQHRISDYCLRKGMAEIDPEEYYQTLQELLLKKKKGLKEKDPFALKSKLARYAIGKGYEQDLVWEAIKEIFEQE
ncbi:regulatory protein RecX [Nafulsella turpanensis]|uniref:regulatory protein RecX n=1 Tax=Nafulsella turpanensis TaxID=1265690 RepID=UPI000348ECE4|nr:RecX family transcriptional regulator [Nafulsella turpanensis]